MGADMIVCLDFVHPTWVSILRREQPAAAAGQYPEVGIWKVRKKLIVKRDRFAMNSRQHALLGAGASRIALFIGTENEIENH